MEFHKENSVSGIVPEYGAIFMSNRATKKECFKQKLFGLPFNRADFVKQVKAGMLLFLFEYEKRKLYGVFEACSDGSMNIAPHAFRSSGKPFSAQIHFTTIWKCNPLSEHEFRDAIKDNYYEAYKFNFGLSQDQVHKLLWLFNTKKIEVQRPRILSIGKSMDVPVKQHKRRKLVRPSFSNVSPCKNGIVSNRCSGNRDEENSGTEESTFKSEGDGDKNLLQKVGMPNVIPPACHGGASGKIEDDSTNEYCQAKGSSQEHFSPEYLLSSAQLSLKKICNMPGCSKGEDNGKWSSQDFGI